MQVVVVVLNCSRLRILNPLGSMQHRNRVEGIHAVN